VRFEQNIVTNCDVARMSWKWH